MLLRLCRRVWYLLHSRKIEADLAEEMAHHRAMLEQQHGEGAARAFGNATLARENAREVWIRPWLESFWQDAAYALHQLRRQPGFAFVAFCILSAAIGLNSSLLTV